MGSFARVAVAVALVAGDAAVLMLGWVLAGWATSPSFTVDAGDPTSLIVTVLLSVGLARTGAWQVDALHRRLDAAMRVSAAGGLAFAGTIAAGHLGFDLMPTRRLLTWWGFAVGGLVLWRQALAAAVTRLRRAGHLVRHVVIVGATAASARLIDTMREADSGMRLLGVFDDRASRVPAYIAGYPVLGGIDDLMRLAHHHPIDLVVVALPWDAEVRLLTCLKRLRRLPSDVRLCPEAIGFRLRHRTVSHLAGVPLLGVVDRPLGVGARLVKALLDRLVAAGALVLAAPLLVTLAVAVRLDGRGPIITSSRRLGFDQTPIEVLRFRTSRPFSKEASPRVAAGTDHDEERPPTALGRVLRWTGLERLPQLMNLLHGQLSLVGPLPHETPPDRRCAIVIDEHLGRHRIRPGVTGWAQIHGLCADRGPLAEVEERLRYDLFYIERWSLLLDLRILVRAFLLGSAAR